MTSHTSLELAARNKRAVCEFYDLLFNGCEPEEAVARYVGDAYLQHNPHVPDGKQAVVDHFRRFVTEYPGKHVEVVRAIAEGDLVALHCHQTWPGYPDFAVVNIFRCDDAGRIVEHWDVLQEVPGHSVNGNTMF